MMNEKRKEDAIIQNLKDAGCNSGTIAAFVDDLRKEKITEGLKILEQHRRTLLDSLHKEQKRIDCLDYLVYTLSKERSLL